MARTEIGDLTVTTDDDICYIFVDDEIAISIPRKDHGLDELVAALAQAIIK